MAGEVYRNRPIEALCKLIYSVFFSADHRNYFTNMASGRRPEHQAPPDVVRLLCFFLFSKAVLGVILLCVIFSSFTMRMKPVNIRPSKY